MFWNKGARLKCKEGFTVDFTVCVANTSTLLIQSMLLQVSCLCWMCLQHVASGFLVEAVSWDVVLSGSTFRLGPSHYTHSLHICGVAVLHTLLDSWTT